MTPKPKEILQEVRANLAQIQAGVSVALAYESYVFVNTIPAEQIHRGITLLHPEVNSYPALAINTTRGQSTGAGAGSRAQDIEMQFAIEGADLLRGCEFDEVAFGLLDDIKAAVILNPNQINSQPFRVGDWLIQEPGPGSDLVLVQQKYSVVYSEHYPWREDDEF